MCAVCNSRSVSCTSQGVCNFEMCSTRDPAEQKSDFGCTCPHPFPGVDGPGSAGGSGAGDRLRAQGRRLGIYGGDLPGGGGPGARESAARGRDLSGAPNAPHLAGAPRLCFV